MRLQQVRVGYATRRHRGEVLELPMDQALSMIDDGRIKDGKTIMLLQHAALRLFTSR